MKWILFTGTWHLCTPEITKDVRAKAHEVLERGDGIVTGGATGVDYEAMMEALDFDPAGSRLQVCLPTNIENYSRDYHHNWIKDYVTPEVVDALIECLYKLEEACPEHVHALPYDAEISQDHYDERHGVEVRLADEVYAFHANGSHGHKILLIRQKRQDFQFRFI